MKEYLHDIHYKNTKDYRRVYFVDIATKNTNKDLSKAVGTTKNADLSRPQQFKDSTESKSSDTKNELTPSPGVIPSGSLTSEIIADLQGSVSKAISMFFDYLSKNDPNWDPDLARLLLTDSSFKKDIMQLVVDLNIDYGDVDKIATNAVSTVFYRIFKCS